MAAGATVPPVTNDDAAERAATIARARRMLKSGQARAIRMAAGLSQGEMASLFPVHRMTLARWEAGTRTPRPADSERLMRVLDELMK